MKDKDNKLKVPYDIAEQSINHYLKLAEFTDNIIPLLTGKEELSMQIMRDFFLKQSTAAIENAIQEIKKNAGTQFDPEIVKVFTDIMSEATNTESND